VATANSASNWPRFQFDPNFGFLNEIFVGSFGAYIVTKVANAGLCDDQFAAREF
jgi:hypothetical protein